MEPFPLALAYLVNQYPKVSHTFIRRELRELERQGERVLRIAIRGSGEVAVDPVDQEESDRTYVCLDQPFARLLLSALRVACTRPARFADAFRVAWRMGRRSPRGLWRHGAYLVEACHLLERLTAADVDHVHVHFGTNPAAVARLIARLGGPSYSLTVHGQEEFDAPEAISLGGKVRDARFAVAISSFGASQVRRWIPFEQAAKVHVVHCAVADSFLAEAEPVDPDSRTLVCVGRLAAAKHPRMLVEALAQLRAEGIAAQLIFAGDGELREEVEALAGRLGVADAIEITGYLNEAQVRERIVAARALVLASVAEGLPVVLMEALALHRPVVATWITGIPELVRPGENGWLVPAGDRDALVSAFREVLAAPAAQLDVMGKAGHERVRERHRLSTEVAKLAALLSEARGRDPRS